MGEAAAAAADGAGHKRRRCREAWEGRSGDRRGTEAAAAAAAGAAGVELGVAIGKFRPESGETRGCLCRETLDGWRLKPGTGFCLKAGDDGLR
jgi:hypothetical protein